MTLFRAAQAALLLMIVAGTAAQAGGYGESNSVKALRALLQAKPDLWTALERAIAEARIDDNATVGAFEAHVNGIVRLVATSRDFESWSRGVVAEWGALPRFAGRRRLQGRGPGLLPVRRLGRHRPVREGCGRSHRRGRHPLSAGSGDRHRLGEAKVERGGSVGVPESPSAPGNVSAARFGGGHRARIRALAICVGLRAAGVGWMAHKN